MSIYDDLKPVVAEVMAEFKQGSISYVHLTPGNGPVDNPGAPTRAHYPLLGTARGAKFKYVQTGLALASDMQVNAASPVGIVPDMRGLIDIDGEEYKIVQIIPKPAAGDPIAYTFIVRKGS